MSRLIVETEEDADAEGWTAELRRKTSRAESKN
jgi:hypothetical protein